MRVSEIDPASYRSSPWKNGGGITIDIADAYRPGSEIGSWDGVIWRFGRTSIVQPGPFSDLTGIDRILVVVTGDGLLLDVAGGETLDVRRPFAPVRFRGEWPITSRLENGPVGVVNLMADRTAADIDMQVCRDAGEMAAAPGTHILYAVDAPAMLAMDADPRPLKSGYSLRIDLERAETIRVLSGTVILASIMLRG